MTINNFKRCEHLTLDFQGRNTNIYGDNATGKSTIYDAFIWLLFGKDAAGRSDYNIKPLGLDGQVLDHDAVTSVEATLMVDGTAVTLRKDYFERWSTKRGSIETTFDGHTSEYYIDGVPLKKGEYEHRVYELVPENVFRVLTSVTYFCQDLPWRERRNALYQVCGLPDDKTIMGTDPQFAELANAMGSLSLDDFKRRLAADRKGLMVTRNSIPARIDEQKKVTVELTGLDFDAVRAERDQVTENREKLQASLLSLTHGTLLEQKKADLTAAENKMAALMLENNTHRQSQMVPVEDRRPAMQAELAKAKQGLTRWEQLSSAEQNLIKRQEGLVEACRKEWAAADAETFSGGTCLTCGQQLPPDAYGAALADFSRRKDHAKQVSVEKANAAKEAIAAARDRLNRYDTERAETEAAIRELTEQLATYQPEAQPEIADLPDFAKKYAEAAHEAAAIDSALQSLRAEAKGEEDKLRRHIQALDEEIRRLDGVLAKQSVLEFAQQRIVSLQADARAAAEQLAQVEKMAYLCEEFTRFKVKFVEGSINARFEMARWKLFQEQINGGLADCCEATYDGVPFTALNSGARINLGLDVIRTLSDHYGLQVPLMVDNAESVTRLLPSRAQVIRLVVNENDKELRVEYEN